MNSIKKKNLKATNQGHSGRCWMFASLNLFRHSLIKALDLPNFEFSEVYLFFWDKFERSNYYLQWFIDHPENTLDDRMTSFMITDFITDGGFWNFYSNLVNKYGLIPKEAMKETFQSEYSDDMNQIIKEKLDSTANYIIKNRNKGESHLYTKKRETLFQIYNTLVKFLGEPPQSFQWAYTNDDNEATVIDGLNPTKFTAMVMPGININDFVTVAHSPNLKYNQTYEVKGMNNMVGGENFRFLNVNINELSKYAIKSIVSGLPVWFVADVSQKFNPYHSALDDQLEDGELVFGSGPKFSKGDRITFRSLQGNHAMTLLGVNVDENGSPESWQVENSWGYYDNETPGEDGFLFMSHSWFKKYLIEIVVHKNFLSRTMNRMLNTPPILLEPWDSTCPALRAGCVDNPYYN
jgi:bleomycin hydrolase